MIGKTYSSITYQEALSKYSEVDILSMFFDIKRLPCVVNSPLRNDKNPSFGLYLNKDRKVRFVDYATDAHGGLMDLLCQYWHCSFTQALDRINKALYDCKATAVKLRPVKTFTRQELNNLTKVEVKVRQWKEYDYEYWRSYGIEPGWLKYAEVYPISHKIVTAKESPEGKKRRYVFTADKYAYVFVERKEGRLQLKIYQPFNTDGFKWCSKMDGSVIGLWTKIPEFGDRVVICSSLKDALCISCQLHIPAICLQGEGYNISKTAENELKRRYKKVFISFDVDAAGIADGKKLAEKTGFINIIPDLKGSKDYSDYYKSLDNKEDFKQLTELFN